MKGAGKLSKSSIGGNFLSTVSEMICSRRTAQAACDEIYSVYYARSIGGKIFIYDMNGGSPALR